jgi:PKD repeat protein
MIADQWGCIADPVYKTIYVNDAPQAGFSIPGWECLRIDYDSTTTDCDLASSSSLYTESLSYLIDFGDGKSSKDPSGSHTYRDCGTYTIVYSVTDAMGCTDTLVKTVQIETVIISY